MSMILLIDAGQEPSRASFGRQLAILLEPCIETRVTLYEHERELEPACFDHFEQVVDARRDRSLLPARDQRSRATAALGELILREAGARTGLTNQIGAPHELSLSNRSVRESIQGTERRQSSPLPLA